MLSSVWPFLGLFSHTGAQLIFEEMAQQSDRDRWRVVADKRKSVYLIETLRLEGCGQILRENRNREHVG